MSIPEVTFETKCYEKDWRFLLKNGHLEKMIEHCNYNFHKRTLFINNVNDISKVEKAAQLYVSKGIIDNYIVVEHFASEALKEFEIDKHSFNGGYYYSIAELVSIFLCETEFLIHFSSDSIIQKSSADWIPAAMKLMHERPGVIVANPVWNGKLDEAKSESFEEDENWYYSYGFSDQCYLVKAATFKKNMYNEFNSASERYPAYGGELFEKRVDAYMRNHDLQRITSKHVSYTHKNFSRNRFQTFVDFLVR